MTKKNHISKYIYIYIFLLIILWIIQLNLVSPDEAFTLRLIQHPINEIIKLDAMDVHPPLYYILLKIFFNITFINHFSPFLQIIMARIFSLGIFFITLILLSYLLSKLLNKKISIKILLGSILLPLTLYYITNIRMYSLAALFITCELLFIYKFNSNSKNIYVFVLTFFSICAAWTHYFSAVIAGILLLYNFIDAIIYKQKKYIIAYLSSGIVFFISFLPWIFISLTQVKNISNNYWITNNIYNYIGMFCYQRLSELVGFNFSNIFSILMIILFFCIIFSTLKSINNCQYKKYYRMILITFLSTIFIGFLLSIIIRPIFVPRYAYPIFIIFIIFNLPILITYFKNENRKIIKITFSILIGIGTFSNLIFGAYNIPKDYQIINYANKLKEDKTIYLNNNTPKLLLSYYFSDKTVITSNDDLKYTVQSDKLFHEIYPNIKFIKNK